MCSVDKERADGSGDNVLLAWEAEGCTPDVARDRALERIHQLAGEFTILTSQTPHLARTLELDPEDKRGLETWTEACALYLSGAGRCQAAAARYAEVITEIAHDHHLDTAISR
ncbi:hypothetical protein [Nocardia pseudobrasiliensis]|nr:hypothetical protein [Nocardia pseudobrasiliensis]